MRRKTKCKTFLEDVNEVQKTNGDSQVKKKKKKEKEETRPGVREGATPRRATDSGGDPTDDGGRRSRRSGGGTWGSELAGGHGNELLMAGITQADMLRLILVRLSVARGQAR